jgi:hypothetical protein
MRRTVMVAVLSVGVIAVGAVPANGAATRAEYIAQVDPICETFVGQVNNAKTAYNRNYKLWVRDLSKGTLKNWVKQTGRTARSLRALSEIHAGLTDQIAPVPPLANDAVAVGTWLNDRRQAETFANAAASAFGHFKFDQSNKKLRQANLIEAAGIRAIAGFGFQVCGVSV